MKHLVTMSVSMDDMTDRHAAFRIISGLAAEIQHQFEAVNVSAYGTDHADGLEPGEIYFDEYTLFKVVHALHEAGIPDKQAEDAINAMQNAGILFRERMA